MSYSVILSCVVLERAIFRVLTWRVRAYVQKDNLICSSTVKRQACSLFSGRNPPGSCRDMYIYLFTEKSVLCTVRELGFST